MSTTIGKLDSRRIVYQGEPGSNSHLACQERYPEAEAVACASFEDCFAAVDSGAIRRQGRLIRLEFEFSALPCIGEPISQCPGGVAVGPI